MPCISSISSSGRKLRLLPSPLIGENVPRSSLFVQRIKPEPSQKSIFNRLRARLTKANKNPDVGSCPRRSLTVTTQVESETGRGVNDELKDFFILYGTRVSFLVILSACWKRRLFKAAGLARSRSKRFVD